MNGDVWLAVLGSGGLLGGLGALLTYLATRGKTKSDARAALDARIDERLEKELERVYSRIDAAEQRATDAEKRAEDGEAREARRTLAMTRVLRTIASQWPTDHGPDLDPADIAELEDTIPSQWIRRGATT